jgi:protease I
MTTNISARPSTYGKPLAGRTVAILATDGFEQSELMEPRMALERAGAKTVVVSPNSDSIKGWDHSDWGVAIEVDVPLAMAGAYEFDALLLPGGVMNPDRLRIDAAAVAFAHDFVAAGKPIAAICHGPWLLIEAGGVHGHRLTSWPSLQNDLRNAGADWVDEEAVVDGHLLTSRKPDDIPAFCARMIPLFAAGPVTAASAR